MGGGPSDLERQGEWVISAASELRRFCLASLTVFVRVGAMPCINTSRWADTGTSVRRYIRLNCKLSDTCCIPDCTSGTDMYECSLEVEGR